MNKENIQIEKKTNYKKWSFKFLIYIILLNFLMAYMVSNAMREVSLVIIPEGYEKPNDYTQIYIMIVSLLATIFMIAGIVLTILSVKNKEEKNYQYRISVWGYPIFIILSLIITLFG